MFKCVNCGKKFTSEDNDMVCNKCIKKEEEKKNEKKESK